MQCLKRLYLENNRPDLADPVDPGTQARFDAGNAVGELARLCFPGGQLVDEPYYRHPQAAETTQSLLSLTGPPTLYEPALRGSGNPHPR